MLDAGKKLVEFVSISVDIEREKVVPTYSDDCLITGAQVRAARALSRWSVLQLSEAADVSASTIRRVEDYDGFTAGIAEALKRLCAAFENQGVEFIFPLTGKPGVRLA